ncbi:response regulator transcription factor [Actinomadura rupiterrae]|uniref:response regulator transcription factor n=1 Tax=Actinomadura rupiterrae TaxID=559627 RepID=UPI0020A5BAA6|nr:response regulator transcription factor [Actinomadura rupiterrae]MCP2343027.1 DNA-binding NarL/FixJ family response regulator [Actinomadura rupiterrae]
MADGTAGAGPVRVLVVDDNPVVRAGLVSVLDAADGIEVAGEAADGRAALAEAAANRPDLVLLDVRMPVAGGLEVVGPLSALAPVVMLSYDGEAATVREAVRRGAIGYLTHGSFTPDELCRAVRDAAAGIASPLSGAASLAVVAAAREPSAGPRGDLAGLGLSAREEELLGLMARGLTNAEIAAELSLSEKTVKNHINRVYGKLRVTHRAAAVARYLGLR